MLHDCGLNIEHYESTQNKYYYDGQTFDLAELKVLVDAISASKFITQRKCDELITKLLTLTTVDNARNAGFPFSPAPCVHRLSHR